MLKLTPILLILLYVAVMWLFSSWRLKQELASRSTPLDHPRLTPLLTRLGHAMDLPPIRAHVYETLGINGLAAPDGRIFLTRGFLDKLDENKVTPEELASVIAHELGHVSLGHSRRRLIDFAGTNVIRTVLIGVVGRFIPFIGPWLAGLAASAIAARLSRQDEFEADRFATALMIRAGLGAGPQKSLFAKLDRMSEGMRSTHDWLMSHPKPEARIRAIEANEASWQR
ncbi:MAG: M48 family metallopeptidase [Paracoccus sp. (in: a-proteobacteria)]|nr:M48 family metallopeptidase [Paracoccus sp. (in: a-proteobacteria)]